jgi:hypothetical protein
LHKHLELREILLYFEKQNLHIPSQLDDKLKTYSFVVESFSKYKKHVKDILDDNTFHLQQLGDFLQNIKDIKSLFLDLETIYDEMGEYYKKISLILTNISDLVIKLPYITRVKTHVTQAAIGDRHVLGQEKSHFYIIDHQVLIDFLTNIKNLGIPEDTFNIQNSPISGKLNQIMKIIPAIKSEYLPDAVYGNVPESFEQIITISRDLRELFSPFYFLEDFDPLREFMELVNKDFYKIEEYFKKNPDKDCIKLKGKFKKAHLNLNKLYRVLSFKRFPFKQ